jgi:catechol 2,3-dioxygenase-like lactoylglutathione lyase family enzyme
VQGREQDEKQLALLALAAVLTIGAVVLVVKVSDETGYGGATTGRLFYLAVALAIFAPNGFAGLNLIQRRPRLMPLGLLTMAAAAFGFVAVALNILGDAGLGGEWHLQGISLAIALAAGQISIVLSFDRDDDPVPLRLLTAGTAVMILVAGLLFADEAAESGHQVSAATIAIFITLYLLGAALLTVFHLADWLERRGGGGGAAHLAPGSLRLDHLVIAVSDRARSARFYGVLLGAEVVDRPGGRIAFKVGDQLLNVHEPGVEAAPLAREPVRPGNSDLCFVWPGSPDLAVATIHELGAELVEGPVLREGAGGSGQSVYTRDPDGALIELISYA